MNINSNPSYSLRLDDKAESTVGAHHCTWNFKWMLMLIWYNAGLFHSNLTIWITSFSMAVIFYPFKSKESYTILMVKVSSLVVLASKTEKT